MSAEEKQSVELTDVESKANESEANERHLYYIWVKKEIKKMVKKMEASPTSIIRLQKKIETLMSYKYIVDDNKDVIYYVTQASIARKYNISQCNLSLHLSKKTPALALQNVKIYKI
jgi:hypothetical protein